ncbi:hypothetical protein D3C80_960580 [compost metagenome]
MRAGPFAHGGPAGSHQAIAHGGRHEGVVDRYAGAPGIENGADPVAGSDVREHDLAEDLEVVVQAIVGLGVDIGPLQRRDQGVGVLASAFVLRIGPAHHAAIARLDRTEALSGGIEDHVRLGAAGAKRQVARRHAQGEIGVAQVAHGNTRRDAVFVIGIGRVGHEGVARAQPPVAAGQTAALSATDVQDSVAAIIVDAGRQAVGLGVVIAASVRAVLEVRLDPVEVVPEDHVDDPGHRVGAIDGRGATRLDLHALN